MKLNLGVVFSFTFRIALAQQQCFDVPGWKDTDGDGCKWYATAVGVDDYYDDKAERCDLYGSCCETEGHTAETACCACGGGILTEAHPSVSPAFTPQPTSTLQNGCVDMPGWSNEGYDCVWFAGDVGDDALEYDDASTRCGEYGAWANPVNVAANDACCVCGGGDRTATPSVTPKPCFDVPDWMDSLDRACAWYEIHDNDPRCDNFGSLHVNKGFVANDACCVCGGGSADAPSASPSNSPNASPSASPSSHPTVKPSNKPSASPITPVNEGTPTQPPIGLIGKAVTDDSGASSIGSFVNTQALAIVLMAGPIYMFI
uniref:Uncharacterized protein n=1 Tax=Leptocylindrus danicus TaxID=163516 RepID=A0A7S2LR02_9STRA|mmetsp:Transcript_8881/g.13159  ORF Transcript_8881/g.13159 Transcript_8881/m.13159 type:complete len:316 (+) Transcript_8881:133-1080(+)|eukprot:CAMPEP_0116024576 /NCGR_PEP_ID=MMETSP0321-20121206/12403_1 /TAXON_ID=163516 /ORGANISM="Leptocylindrus danicus var. danicus, Strain B650" /LENGTH=315 /DNA_ID=CAMNT_0003496341 /DNA_START=101 /DNA_END=1048 /DNA_ORIENTATION=+